MDELLLGQTELPTQPSNRERGGHGLGHLLSMGSYYSLSILVLGTTSLRGKVTIERERERHPLHFT